MSEDDKTNFHKKIIKICHENCKYIGLEFAENVSALVVQEIGDGNLNYLHRISAAEFKGTNSALAKHGPPYIKCLGPQYPLSTDRTKVEYSALKKFNSIVPGSVPRPLFWVPDLNMFVMEDLKGYEVLRSLLIKGINCEQAVLELAKNIAVIHRRTHISALTENEFKAMIDEYKNENMVALTKDFVFTHPFVREEQTNRCADNVQPLLSQIYDNPKLLQTAEKMRSLFLERKECLVHGDLHTGSVMCTADGCSPKMIDLEFTYVGPCAFDVGMFLANLIFTYYQHMSTPQDNDTNRQYSYNIIELCKRFVEVYLEHMSCVTDQLTFISDVTGFCGCEIIRRLVGAAHVDDFKDLEYGEQEALGAGIRLLQAVDRIDSIDRLMVIALMLT